jgi:hypothetical protein
MAHKNADKTVAEILVGKKASVRNAPLEGGSPSWGEIEGMMWEEVVEKAEADAPGFRTIKKLLGDKRFDK